MSLTRTRVPLEAVRTLLTVEMPPLYAVSLDGGSLADGTTPVSREVIIDPVTTPDPQWVTMGAPERSTMLIQVTIRDTTREGCRLAGDHVRDVLTSRRRGGAVYPLDAAGYTFDVPTSQQDGHVETSGGVHTWVETFRLGWQYRVAPPA